MENENHVKVLYTDFSKTFDCINIPMLLFKLKNFGTKPTFLKWLESYLTERHQTVRYKGMI